MYLLASPISSLPPSQVAEANSTAEESVTRLKAALKEARRATVAHTLALADALGVETPGTLLSCPEKDEYLDRFSKKDAETIEGDARLPSPSAGNNAIDDDRVGMMAAVDRGSVRKSSPTSDIRDSRHVAILGSSGKATPQHQKALHSRELTNDQAESPVSTTAGQGWNREWSRTVDAWCREECDLFRKRVAVEITKAAHRLHWLSGPIDSRYQLLKTMERCDICRRRCDGKRWAALGQLGDRADLLELVRCTLDLVVLVESVSPPPDFLAAKAPTEEMNSPTVDERVERTNISERPVTAGVGHAGRPRRLLEPPRSDARVGLKKERGVSHNAAEHHVVNVPWSSKFLPLINEESIIDVGSEGEGGTGGRCFEKMAGGSLHADPAFEGYDAGVEVFVSSVPEDLPADDEAERCPGISRRTLERNFARLVLDPATIAEILGIKPLSAFALRAARQQANPSLPPSASRELFNATAADEVTGEKAGIFQRATKQDATKGGQPIRGEDDVEARAFTPARLELPAEQLLPHLPFSTRVSIEEGLLSDREKHELAFAFETFVLPRLRISWPESGCARTARPQGDGILPHLSLEPAEVGGKETRQQQMTKATGASDDAEGQEVEASSPANPLALLTETESLHAREGRFLREPLQSMTQGNMQRSPSPSPAALSVCEVTKNVPSFTPSASSRGPIRTPGRLERRDGTPWLGWGKQSSFARYSQSVSRTLGEIVDDYNCPAALAHQQHHRQKQRKHICKCPGITVTVRSQFKISGLFV